MEIFFTRQKKSLTQAYAGCVSDSEKLGNAILNRISAKTTSEECSTIATFMTLFSHDLPIELLRQLYAALKPLKAAANAIKTIEHEPVLTKMLDESYTTKRMNLERNISQIVQETSAKQSIPDNFDKTTIQLRTVRKNLAKLDDYGHPWYMLAQIRFRGYREEVDKLIACLTYKKVEYVSEELPTGIWEVRCTDNDLQDHYLEIIKNIPALKVTGLLEGNDWYVHAFISESGAAGITGLKSCTTYDMASDAPDDRWAYSIDMTKDYRHSYVFIKTNDTVRTNYNYPYPDQCDSRTAYADVRNAEAAENRCKSAGRDRECSRAEKSAEIIKRPFLRLRPHGRVYAGVSAEQSERSVHT